MVLKLPKLLSQLLQTILLVFPLVLMFHLIFLNLLKMKKYRIETQDFVLYMDAKSLADAVDKLVIKYGEFFANTINLIKEI